MPKKDTLIKVIPFLCIIVPTVLGYLGNYIVMLLLPIPLLFSLYLYGMPILVICFWFWVGGRFARNKIKLIPSILIGNSVGIISLVLYIWQFMILSGEQRNQTLAGFSQYFYIGVGILSARIGALFEPVKNHYGSVTTNGMIIFGLILMILIFTAGYISYKRKIAKADQQSK